MRFKSCFLYDINFLVQNFTMYLNKSQKKALTNQRKKIYYLILSGIFFNNLI